MRLKMFKYVIENLTEDQINEIIKEKKEKSAIWEALVGKYADTAHGRPLSKDAAWRGFLDRSREEFDSLFGINEQVTTAQDLCKRYAAKHEAATLKPRL